MKANRWYLKVLVDYVDICKVNGWLMYRRDADQLSVSKRKQMTLLSFSTKTADKLFYESNPIGRSVGHPPKRQSLDDCSEGPQIPVLFPSQVIV